MRVGEIWISGPSVAKGYWHKPAETEQTFGARLESGEGPFLRTGDLGFLDNGQVFVTGRLKDLIIIRGSNHYPQDLEHTVERSHRALRPASGAAFSVESDGAERLVIVQEVNDSDAVPGDDAVTAIRRALTESHDLHPEAVVLHRSRAVFRGHPAEKFSATPAGTLFWPGGLEVVHEWRDLEAHSGSGEDAASHPRSGLVWDYLSNKSYSHRLAGNLNSTARGDHRPG